jgi:hypothetical protein
MVNTDYTLAQLNSNIFPKADDIASAGPVTIQALFDRFKDCDLGDISADHMRRPKQSSHLSSMTPRLQF